MIVVVVLVLVGGGGGGLVDLGLDGGQWMS